MNAQFGGLLVPLEFRTPGVQDFRFDGLFGTTWFNKPMILAIIAAALVIGYWVWASSKLNVRPSKAQFAAEYIYDFIRNGVAREMIGPEFKPFVPYLVGLFSFVLLNNWFGQVFLFMFPTMSVVGYAYGLTIISFLLYNVVGIKKHGLTYFKNMTLPHGVPKALWIIIIPIEILSNFIVRPVTLAVRLFANMFAGHLAVMVFVIGGAYLLTYSGNLFYNGAGLVSYIFGIAFMGFELFIGFLQAYIFTILTAQYVGSSLAEGH